MDDFKELEFEDKKIFDECFHQDPPRISEFTFTNLFMWRHQYRPLWRLWRNCLLIILRPAKVSPFGLFPAGAGEKMEALDVLCRDMNGLTPEARVCRVDDLSVHEFVNFERYYAIPDRDNSDYVYLTEDLIRLAGKRFHKKKNHVNQFVKNHAFEYREMDEGMVGRARSGSALKTAASFQRTMRYVRSLPGSVPWIAGEGRSCSTVRWRHLPWENPSMRIPP